jgi:hypothetical protein
LYTARLNTRLTLIIIMRYPSIVFSIAIGFSIIACSPALHAQTWENITTNVPKTLRGDTRVMDSDGVRLYVLTLTNGVYVSSDNGNSFAPVNDVEGGVYGMTNKPGRFIKYVNGSMWVGWDPGSAALPGTGPINYGAASLHRLTPGETVWHKSSNGFPIGDTGNQADDIAYDASTGTYYAAAALGGAFVSSDGTNWQQRSTGLGGVDLPVTMVAFDGMAFEARGLEQVQRTTNQGVNWSAVQSHQGYSTGLMIEKNGRLMFISNGPDRFNYSDDHGATWNFTTNGVRQLGDLSAKDGLLYASGLIYGSVFESFLGRPGLKFSATDGITWDNLPTAGLPIDPSGSLNVTRVVRQGNYLFLYFNLNGVISLYRYDVSGFDFTPTTQIAQQPITSTNRLVGQPFTLDVLAGGTNLTYQWRFNGTNLAGAIASAYSVASAQTNNSGSYTVVVTGDRGSVTSTVATVTIGLRADGRADITYSSPGTGSGSQLYLLPDYSIVTVNGANLIKLNSQGARILTNTFASSIFSTGFLDSSNRLLLVNSSGINRVRRVNVTNLLDDPGFAQLTANNTINSITELPGRGYLVVGNFSSVTNAGVSTNARSAACLIGYNGLVDTNFNIGVGPGAIARMVVDSGTNIYALGTWTFWGSDYELTGCVKLKSDGSRDLTFSSPSLSNARFMRSIAPGRLLVEDSGNKLIIIDPNGVRDNSFNSANRALNAANTINAIAVGESNKLYLAGIFTSYGATNVGKYMRLMPDGTFDPSFYTEAPANGGFAQMVYDARGYLHMMRNSSSGAFQGLSFGFGPYRVFAGTNEASASGFDAWAMGYTFPPGRNNPQDDADGDGIPNVFEFYFGSNPTNAASGDLPAETTVIVSGHIYPAITFIRSKTANGVTLIPQVSSSVLFNDWLGSTVESLVDLGNGTEQVTIRSNVSVNALPMQYLRIQLSVM